MRPLGSRRSRSPPEPIGNRTVSACQLLDTAPAHPPPDQPQREISITGGVMRLAVRSTVIASALAIATIAAPAASARYDLGPSQRLNDGNPAAAYAVPVAPPQA